MNLLLRLFGMHEDDWERPVLYRCSECGQVVRKGATVRPLTALEQAVADFDRDYISAEQLERRIAAAVRAEST